MKRIYAGFVAAAAILSPLGAARGQLLLESAPNRVFVQHFAQALNGFSKDSIPWQVEPETLSQNGVVYTISASREYLDDKTAHWITERLNATPDGYLHYYYQDGYSGWLPNNNEPHSTFIHNIVAAARNITGNQKLSSAGLGLALALNTNAVTETLARTQGDKNWLVFDQYGMSQGDACITGGYTVVRKAGARAGEWFYYELMNDGNWHVITESPSYVIEVDAWGDIDPRTAKELTDRQRSDVLREAWGLQQVVKHAFETLPTNGMR